MDYILETHKAMNWLGKQKRTFFLGQTVEYPGSPMFSSLQKVPKGKKLEMPVAEDMQMGISIGMSLEGFIPISIFPRMDFLICATNQLVNHLNLVREMSNGEFTPGVIIRTQIGNNKPLNPGPQHTGNHYVAIKKMCPNIKVVKLTKASQIVYQYKKAYLRALSGESTILIETPQGGKNPNVYKK